MEVMADVEEMEDEAVMVVQAATEVEEPFAEVVNAVKV
jgi:hypothetical protein